MSATTFAVETTLPRTTTMSSLRLRRAYLAEIKFECLRALRAPAFAIPFLLLPLVLYILFGVFLAGSMSKGDPTIAKIMFVNWSIFGIMGPGMFGFGMFVATERGQGLLTLKRALPMPPAAYLLSKIVMAVLFSAIVMITLVTAALALGHPGFTAAQYAGVSLLAILGSSPFCAVGLFIGTLASAKSAPAFANLAYLPFMHLGGLFYPLPKSVQPMEFLSPAFYLDKLALRLIGAPSLDQLAMGATGPSSHVTPVLAVAVLAGVTLLFTALSIRRLARVG
jgi:ABC-2 type transport system permease protein